MQLTEEIGSEETGGENCAAAKLLVVGSHAAVVPAVLVSLMLMMPLLWGTLDSLASTAREALARPARMHPESGLPVCRSGA